MPSSLRVLMVTVGSLGDLHPCMGLAREMKRRGHRPVIATSLFHKEYIENAGFAFAPLRPNLTNNEPEIINAVLDPIRGPELLHRKFIFPYLEETLEDMIPLARESDVILSSILSYTAPIAGQITGKPVISALLSPMVMWSGYEPTLLSPIPRLGKMTWLAPLIHRLCYRLLFSFSASWTRPVNDLRQKHGLPRINIFGQSHCSPGLMLCLWSEWFSEPRPDWPPQAKPTGFIFYDPNENQPLSAELEAFLSAGEPPVVFALGSTVVERAEDFVKLFQESLKLEKRRAVLVVGKKLAEIHRSQINEQLYFADYAPYGKLFSRSSLIVHQGGVGTTGQALRSGHPMIILPSCTDQPDNAQRVQRRGLGAVLPLKRANPKRLAKLIRDVLADTAMRERCKATSQKIARENGAEAAMNALEEFLSSRM